MLRAADTVGVFQVESRAQMATLPRMKPERFYDLVVEVAIIRPGPIVGKMVNPYLERRNGREPVRYPHPSLEPILGRTLGVPLFQEQLIRMAMTAAGFTGGQAEELRRAMGFKRSQERMNVIEKDLRAGMAKNGITGAAQEEIIQGIKSFALYGFPESHAASFALLAYASAYLKAHHPAAFACALLNNWPMGFYHPSTLVNDAVRHGVSVQPDRRHPLRLALRSRGRRAVAAARPALRRRPARRGRQTGRGGAGGAPFASLADFAARAAANSAELATLAEIGAFGSLGATRRSALWQVEALGRSGALFSRGRAFRAGDLAAARDGQRRRDGGRFRRDRICRPGRIRFRFCGAALDRRGITRAADLARVPNGRRARVAGVVIVRQRPGTAKGFVFITLEDETGFANAIVTPKLFERDRRTIVGANALIIDGVVQNQEGVVSIKADRFEPLYGRTATIDVSHDFH